MHIQGQLRPLASRAAIPAAVAAALSATSLLASPVALTAMLRSGPRPGNLIGTGSSLATSDQASNIMEANDQSRVTPRLPSPRAASDTLHDLLRAAVRALEAGRTGEAQEALERAETRLLSCSAPPTHIGQPSTDPLIARIGKARQLPVRSDLAQAASLARAALPSDTTDVAS